MIDFAQKIIRGSFNSENCLSFLGISMDYFWENFDGYFFFFDLLRILDCDGYLLLGIFFFLVIGFVLIKAKCKYQFALEYEILTRRPSIWFMAADSFKVHSATTLARISFMYNINAFNGFLICGFFFSLICSWEMNRFRIWEMAIVHFDRAYFNRIPLE